MKVQLYLPFDCTTLANYLAWSENGISAAMATLGYTRTADTGQVIWANVTSVPHQPPLAASLTGVSAWTGGAAYTGSPNVATAGTFSVVTNVGLTYACILNTQTPIQTVVQNTNTSTVSTAVAVVSGGNTVYTASVSGATTNSLVGYLFVASGGSVSQNNGTFACVANTTTSVTLSNGLGAAQSTGTLPTLTSSTANIGYVDTSGVASAASNAFVGLSVTTTGLTAGANNTTFTVTASGSGAASTGVVCGTVSGTNATGQSGFLTMATAPVSDPLHWVGYNYEIWQSTDASSSTNPFYIRFVYSASTNPGGTPYTTPCLNFIVGTSTNGQGWVQGNIFSSASSPSEFVWYTYDGGTPGGTTLYECDFSANASGGNFSMLLYRQVGELFVPIALVIDRAKDTFGNDLPTYIVCLFAMNSQSTEVAQQVLFQPGTGTTLPVGAAQSGWNSLFVPTGGATSLLYNGNVPLLPLFPLFGYIGNPLLGAALMMIGDCIEGQLVNAYLYGAIHTYLVSKQTLVTRGGTGLSTNGALAIRWE